MAAALSVLILPAGAFSGPSLRTSSDDGVWTQVFQIPNLPSGWGMFDGARDRLVVAENTRTWAMDPNDVTWSILAEPQLSSTAPGTRGIYDVAHDRALVIVEYLSGSAENPVSQFAFSGAPGWQPVSTTGAKLFGRGGFSVILDPARDRALVFGGVMTIYGPGGQPAYTYYNDVHALSLTTGAWTNLTTSGTPPSPRAYHAAAYDPVRDRMVVFGGTGSTANVWYLDLATLTWSYTVPTGPVPGTNAAVTMAYDPGADRMLLFGGAGHNELWELPLPAMTTFNQLTPSGGTPSPRYSEPVLLPDPTRNLFWLWDGSVTDYLWSLDVSGAPAWTNRSILLPPPRFERVAIYDPDHHALVLNGGGSPAGPNDDTWSLALEGSVPAWTNLAPAGTLPTSRYDHSGIFDPNGHRLVIWGGLSAVGGTRLNDLWQLDLSGPPTWTQLAPIGAPPSARYAQSTAFDPLRRRMIVFGGVDPAWRNDVWELGLSGTPTWTQLAALGTPPDAQANAPAVYDVARDRLLLVDRLHPGQVWALSPPPLPQWTLLSTSGSVPGYWDPLAILDPVRDRLVVKYGSSEWALPLDGPLVWETLHPSGESPAATSLASMIYDPTRDRLLLVHGSVTHALNWTSPTAVAGPPSVGTMLGPSRPNPARDALSIPFELTQRSGVEIVVYDLAGRKVGVPFRGEAGPGEHEVRWNLRTERGERVRPGVYVYSMQAGAARAVRRLVVVP